MRYPMQLLLFINLQNRQKVAMILLKVKVSEILIELKKIVGDLKFELKKNELAFKLHIWS